jgi:deoxyadenosine/deoxycytidine kinase/NTP pyrophosphatase (non-canonical NTP hydrolase)
MRDIQFTTFDLSFSVHFAGKFEKMSHYIVIEGVIGVGKTSLARYLNEVLDTALVLERFDENPFLSNFYADRAQYAFQTQIFFLLSRYQQQQNLLNMPRPLVTDYLFAKDHLFAQLNLQGDELATYEGLYYALTEKIPVPDLVVYLQASASTLMSRIAHRDRPYERNMDPDYIMQLRQVYERFFAEFSAAPVMIVNADEIDFVANPQDRYHLIEDIRQKLQEQPARAKELPHQAIVPTRYTGFNPTTHGLEDSSRRLPDFQQFHRYLDQEKGFNTNLLLNMVKLQEEIGELSRAVARHWSGHLRGETDVALQAIASEMADVLAYILKIANYTGIDLEAAYLAKMALNRTRQWKTPEGE